MTRHLVGVWSDDGFGQQPVDYVCHHIRARATVQLALKYRPGGVRRGVAGRPCPKEANDCVQRLEGCWTIEHCRRWCVRPDRPGRSYGWVASKADMIYSADGKSLQLGNPGLGQESIVPVRCLCDEILIA